MLLMYEISTKEMVSSCVTTIWHLSYPTQHYGKQQQAHQPLDNSSWSQGANPGDKFSEVVISSCYRERLFCFAIEFVHKAT